MPQDDLGQWEVLNSQTIFVADPWITISVQKVRLPDDRVVNDYHRIVLPEYVMIFAQTGDGRVVVERSYKHGAGRTCLSLPAGLIGRGEDPLTAAQRELLEETGFISEEWESLGSFVPHGNYGCGQAHLFTTRNARQVAEPNSGDLEDMEIHLMRMDDIVDAFHQGEVALLGIVATLALATNPLFRNQGR